MRRNQDASRARPAITMFAGPGSCAHEDEDQTQRAGTESLQQANSAFFESKIQMRGGALCRWESVGSCTRHRGRGYGACPVGPRGATVPQTTRLMKSRHCPFTGMLEAATGANIACRDIEEGEQLSRPAEKKKTPLRPAQG